MRCEPAYWPMATTTTFFGARASRASSQAPIGARSRLIRNTAALCSVDEDLAQVDVAAFANAEQPRLASSRILSWHDTPSHAAKSRGPFRKAAPLPMAATMAVATIGPIPGICRMRVQPGSAAEIRSSSRVRSPSIWSSTVFHSFQRRSIRLRICGVKSRSTFSRMSGSAARSLAGVFAKTRPRSSRNARNWLMTAVRPRDQADRELRWMACRSSWSSVLIGTKRMFLRSTASAIAFCIHKVVLVET